MIIPQISLSLIQNSSYFILFILMFFEGPIVTFAASFLASQGIFNIYIIFILSILGNIIPDTGLFLIGKFSRLKTIDKFSHLFGLTETRINKIETGFSKHTGKSIIFFKLIPGLAVPGLVIAGFSKVSLKKFLIISTTFNILTAIFFSLLGFYSGITISSFLNYLKLEKYIIIALAIFIVLIYLAIRYIRNNFK